MSKPGQKTLFSYFVKSPTSGGSPKASSAVNNQSPAAKASPSAKSTPTRPALAPSNNETPKLKVKQGSSFTGRTPKTPGNDKAKRATPAEAYKETDLVWAKLDGYPWWPSLVCQHPVKKKIQFGSKVHVQFFDDPPTRYFDSTCLCLTNLILKHIYYHGRSWIEEKLVRPYNGATSFEGLGGSRPSDKKWDAACKEADAAVAKTKEERLQLVTCLAPSDEENSLMSEDNSTPKITRKTKAGTKGPQPKRRRILSCASDDEEDEYKPEDTSAMELDESCEVEDSLMEEEEELEEDDDVEESPVAKGKKRKRPSTSKSTSNNKEKLLASFSCDSPSVSMSTKKKLSDFSCKDADGLVCGSQDEGRTFTHLALDWLKPDKIRDAQGHRPDDDDYDQHTLLVPTSFKQNLTPAMVN